MTKQSKKLILAFIALILLFVGCASNPSDLSLIAAVGQNIVCPTIGIDIEGPASRFVHSGDPLTFAANKESNDWDYRWSTASGEFSDNFSDAQAMETIFTVPQDIEAVTIMLTVVMSSACEETAEFEISIILDAPTATATATLTPTPAATMEPTATATVEPTATASATPLPMETATATAVPTNPPLPMATALPTITDPIITQLEFLPGGAVQVAWSWDGELSPTQNFAVRFWSVEDSRPEARFSIIWTKERSYQFGVNSTQFPIGTYYVNVAIMDGPSEGVHYELAHSEDLSVFVNSPPPPPTPPIP